MPARRTRRDRIIDATMALAGELRWREVTLTAIAGRARVSLADLRSEFSGRSAILAAFFDRIDVEMLTEPEGAGDEADEAPRDRLFDLVMRRLDALGPYKAALRNIAAEYSGRPAATAMVLKRVMRTQHWVLDAAGVSAPGVRGKLKTLGLTAVYLNTFQVWLDEDEPGLPRTMARLDRLLRRGETALERADAPVAFAESLCAVMASLSRRRREAAAASADGAGNGQAA